MTTLFHAATVAAKECASLMDPSFVNLFFSSMILIGILISYLPQHHRIISRGTSEGISPLFLLLGVTSGTCTLANILILSRGVLGCCGKGIGAFNCFAASLGVVQVGMQWTGFAVILLLFLIYFPRASPLELPATTTTPGPSTRTALTVTLISIAHLFAVAVATFYFSLLTPDVPHTPESPIAPSPQLVAWANFLGIQSTILASLQYIPQLYTTWTLKHVGSLSIPMMCIQTPGSFVWAISLASREGTKWSSWVTYVVTGCLQGGLLVMCILWEMKSRKEGKKAGGDGVRENGSAAGGEERRPLLGNETS